MTLPIADHQRLTTWCPCSRSNYVWFYRKGGQPPLDRPARRARAADLCPHCRKTTGGQSHANP